jgi:hypothetical protein
MKRNISKVRKQLSPKQQKQLKIKYAERMLFDFPSKTILGVPQWWVENYETWKSVRGLRTDE